MMSTRLATRLGVSMGALLLMGGVHVIDSSAGASDGNRTGNRTGNHAVDHAVDLAAEPAVGPAPAQKRRGAAPFTPRRGVIFNNPIGRPDVKYRIFNKIVNSIRSTPTTGYIRIMSWNVFSNAAVNALLAAQRRGVKIRVLIDRSNLTEIPNPSFGRLVRGFAANNQGRRPQGRSYAKACRGSCRGKGGQAHAKFFLFSETGKAERVVMQGSANLTAASAINQWNDLYTFIGNKNMYRFTRDVFEQMWLDKPVANPYVSETTANGTLFFSPFGGANYVGDPVQQLLNNVRCTGAQDAGNRKGRTIIRVAPDVMRQDRGMRGAVRLRQLWDAGCDVKIAYTILSPAISRLLRDGRGRGPVPLRHLVQDFDGDGEFDNYFHLKAISINGVVGPNKNAYVTVNGSSNLSGVASVSDENIGIIKKQRVTLLYQRYIDFWFNNAPSSAFSVARRGDVDPYAHVDMD